MILSYSSINKLFGEKYILEQVSSRLRDHEKAAIVGINGVDKSALLRAIIGELVCDEGCVALSKGASIDYLAQYQDLDGESTIHDAPLRVKRPVLRMERRVHSLELDMKSASGKDLENMLEEYNRLTHRFELEGGYACRSEIIGILRGLNSAEEEFSKPINALSGDQKTRVSLDKPLLIRPDILLLNEPTNHLDTESIAWLETHPKIYSGSVVIVAHDHYSLDRVVAKIVELDNETETVSSSNYTAYGDKKAVLRNAKIRAYLNQQQEIRHQEAATTELKPFNREKSIRRTESREKMPDKVDRLEKPMGTDDSMGIRLEPDVENGKDALIITSLSKSFDNQTPFTDVSSETEHGERVATVDNNDIGKTTLLKIINQLLLTDAGKIRLDFRVHIGYYDQEHQVLHMGKTLFDEIQGTYSNMNNTQIRSILASFLFTGDGAFKLIRDLGDGEWGRISLAKLMLSDADFLFLDELTSCLDITSKEVLESALRRYTGAVFYISHDRYFIDRIATKILDLTGQFLIDYIGSYGYYLGKKDVAEAAFAARNSRTSAVPGPSQSPDWPFQGSSSDLELEWKTQKEEQTRIRKVQNEPRKTEESTHALEARDNGIDAFLTPEEVYTNVPRLMELNKGKEEIVGQLGKLYQGQEELAEKA